MLAIAAALLLIGLLGAVAWLELQKRKGKYR